MSLSVLIFATEFLIGCLSFIILLDDGSFFSFLSKYVYVVLHCANVFFICISVQRSFYSKRHTVLHMSELMFHVCCRWRNKE